MQSTGKSVKNQVKASWYDYPKASSMLPALTTRSDPRSMSQVQDDCAFVDYMATLSSLPLFAGRALQEMKPRLSRRLGEVVVQPRAMHVSMLPILSILPVSAPFTLARGLSTTQALAYLNIVEMLLRTQGVYHRRVYENNGHVVICGGDKDSKWVWTSARKDIALHSDPLHEDPKEGFGWSASLEIKRVIDIRCTPEFAKEFQEFLPRQE